MMSEAKVIAMPKNKTVKFPLYRKYNGGTEYQKVASATAVIHITNAGTYWNISFDTASADIIETLINDPMVEPCTRDDFEKIYGNAQWVLTQINIAQ